MLNLSLIDSMYFTKYLIDFNFNFLLIISIFNILLYSFNINSPLIKLNKINFFNITKYLNIFSILISFLLHLISLWFYKMYTMNYIQSFNNDFLLNFNIKLEWYSNLNHYTFNFFKLNFSIDFFGLMLLTLAYLVGFISVLTLDNRLNYNNNLFLTIFNVFILIVYIYITSTNIFIFFICYELLLIPSFLIVYYLSPSRKAIQASIYFVIWTQLGSLLVLFSICYIVIITNSFIFIDIHNYIFSSFDLYIIYFFLFLGFGFKVPIWPFHYWLTKTHVEAPSGFSIYLSGFLVKTALYGFYNLTTIIHFNINTTFFIFICIYSTIDSSIKMWGQTDLKKLVAYGTIQEMNVIYLLFCTGDSNTISCGILFSVTHAFLSALMFFLVDCIYRRFQTRSIVELNGIMHITPNLGISIILMLVFFSGLPGTAKFSSEFYLFSTFIEIFPISTLMLFVFMNVIGLIGFSKSWFNILFGLPKKKKINIINDLSLKELYIIYLCLFLLIIFSYYTYLFI